jgi:hypothetical protein
MTSGRPPGRPLTELEQRHLLLLLELRERAASLANVFVYRLEDFVLEMREAGCSARGMAEQCGVSSATIQTWTTNARKRRDG